MNLSQNFQRKGGRYYKKSSCKAGALQVEEDFDRTRFGGGAAYRQGDFRATVELVKAEGMIPNSVDSGGIPGTLGNNGPISFYNLLPEEDAFGWHLDMGYQVVADWWLDVRYDRLDRGMEISGNERRFTTLTLGSHYYFTPTTRLMFNYEIRDNEAPNLADNAPQNIVFDTYDDRVSVQLFWMF